MARKSLDKYTAGWNHTVARLDDGTATAWGWNNQGQCNIPSPPVGSPYVQKRREQRRSLDSVIAAGKDHGPGGFEEGQ